MFLIVFSSGWFWLSPIGMSDSTVCVKHKFQPSALHLKCSHSWARKQNGSPSNTEHFLCLLVCSNWLFFMLSSSHPLFRQTKNLPCHQCCPRPWLRSGKPVEIEFLPFHSRSCSPFFSFLSVTQIHVHAHTPANRTCPEWWPCCLAQKARNAPHLVVNLGRPDISSITLSCKKRMVNIQFIVSLWGTKDIMNDKGSQ